MVIVVFHLTDFDPMYGLGSEKNYINEWVYNSNVMGADKIIMIDSTDLKIGKNYKHNNFEIQYEYCESLNELNINHSQLDYTWVFLESKDIVSNIVTEVVDLNVFNHPDENVIYIFGPDFSSISYNEFTNSKWVYFITDKNKPLYALPSSTIVLYDRVIKKNKTQ